jgi:hypothetical protein
MNGRRARTRLESAVFVVLAAVVLSVPFAGGRFVAKAPISGFGAFYCAGRIVRAGHDPYRVQPLLDCERSLPSYRYDAVGVVEPAPLPPFVLAAFGVLALLPFGWALSAFIGLSVAAVAAAAWALGRITGFGLPFVGAALLFSALYDNMLLAEIPPLVVGILSLAALLAERKRLAAAGAVAALALVEPNVSAPVIVAMFLAFRPARWPLAGAAVVAAGLSLATVGFATTVAYFTSVLPAHAASEVAAKDQYSLTWALHQFGASDVLALRAGGASYLVAAFLGVVVALRLAERFRRPALVVLVPAAFAMIGGTYVHDLQLPIAIPAALVLLTVVAAPLRPVVMAGIVLLAVPWYGSRVIWAAAAVIGVMLWYSPLAARAPVRRAGWAAAVCAVYLAVVFAIHLLPDLPRHAGGVLPDVSGSPHELASAVWARFVRATAYGQSSLRDVAVKLPLWSGLLIVGAAALVQAARPKAKRIVVMRGEFDAGSRAPEARVLDATPGRSG